MKEFFSILIFILMITIQGCSFSEYQAKEEAKSKAIINAVINSESTITGTKTVDALSIVLAASGKYVKIDGWSCDKNSNDNSYDVWLKLTVNDNLSKLHWVVDKNNNLYPANDLTQKITVRQKLAL